MTFVGSARATLHGHNRVRIDPPYGTTAQDGHGGFCTQGFNIRGADVLEFLDKATRSRKDGSPRRP
jgi:hypothetical protein